MQVRIYKAIKNPMQSGDSLLDAWILESDNRIVNRFLEPLMNRTSSKNMSNEIKLKFSKLEEAIRFAEKNNYIYEIITHHMPKIIKKSYSSNFK